MPRLFHFSDDPAITLFKPHLARTSVEPHSFVWAIDESHAPSYWFPRDCPRACCWAGDGPLSEVGASLLGPGTRLQAVEREWLDRIRTCRLYVYEFDPEPFRGHIPEAGYWIAQEDVVPLSVLPVGNLLERHVEAGIDLRIVDNLWPLIDAIVTSGLQFSIIRKANARARNPEFE